MAKSRQQAVVVGAGVVGLCTALQLLKDGWEVTLVDRGPVGGQCSYGNAGILANDVILPIPSPSTLRQMPSYLLSNDTPISIKWRYLPYLLPWLYRFILSCRRSTFFSGTTSLAALTLNAVQAYEELMEDGFGDGLIQKSGALQVFETDAAFASAKEDAKLRQAYGSGVEILSAREVSSLVPQLNSIYKGGLFRPSLAFVREPSVMMARLHERFRALGGRTLRLNVTRLAAVGAQWRATGFLLGDNKEQVLSADIAVVSCGAWSSRLLRSIGLGVMIDTERGYHINLPYEGNRISLPILSGEGGFYMTPMLSGLRLAGRVEFAGVDAPADYRQCELILRRARHLLPGLDERGQTVWMGRRPSTPDSLPVIGPVPGKPGLFLGFGHGHLGLTLAAVTGRLIAQVASGRTPDIDIAPFRPDRRATRATAWR